MVLLNHTLVWLKSKNNPIFKDEETKIQILSYL